MKRCAFLTMEDLGDFVAYDDLLHGPLADRGWEVIDVPWTASVNWSNFDAVIIRSPWDYQKQPSRFLNVLQEIESCGVPLMNSAEVCRWNLDKRYLRELHEAGVNIIPTRWLDCLRPADLDDLWQLGERIVTKPWVGAGADDTFVLEQSDSASWSQALEVYAGKPLMVQGFVQSICDVGEYSLFYFGGKYSHAILKRPKHGDFRVQEEHGGQISAAQPQSTHLELAEQALSAVGHRLLYARVDIVHLDDGTAAIIELELIEPSLYFPYDQDSPERFADAFCAMVP